MKEQLNSPNFMKSILLFLILWLLFSFLAINRHSKSKLFSYQSEFWADKAGYLVYLPMTFHFHWKNGAMPDSVAQKSGNGFSVQDGKVISKYPIGTALMVAPFYFTAYLFDDSGEENLGLGAAERYSMNIAAAFWLCIGLFCLFGALNFYFDTKSSIFAIVATVLGTNLFYYSVFEGTMSHVYSFSLFSMLWNVVEKLKRNSHAKPYLIGFVVVSALIFIVRPINVLFIPIIVFFVFNGDFNGLKNLIRGINVPSILVLVVLLLLLIFPQMMYWKYASGSWLHYAYGNESFSNLFQPKINRVLFSTNNGLLVYNPIWLIVFGFVAYKIWTKSRVYSYIGIIFFVMILICSTWHIPTFGCSYGQRNFVDISCFFAFVVGGIFKEILIKDTILKTFLFLIVSLLCLYNLKLIFSYDFCWYGGDWDAEAFGRLLLAPLK